MQVFFPPCIVIIHLFIVLYLSELVIGKQSSQPDDNKMDHL